MPSPGPRADRAPGSLYWKLSLAESREVYLGPGAPMPLGWSADGAWLTTSSAGSGRMQFLRMPAGGGKAETIFEWPFGGEMGGTGEPFSADRRWLCTVESWKSDIWLAERLDSSAK